ncbi:MAG: hypothetical protein ACU841_05335 [Gammaproteobacteria bacterium]
MPAQFISTQDIAQHNPIAVSLRLLLGLYLVIPVCILLQLLDSTVWQGYLKESLPGSPSHFLLYQILFGTPHILASTIVLISNRDYIEVYKWKVIRMSVAIILIFGIGSLYIPYRVLYILVACWTVLHVLKQQHGIARGLCRLPNWAFHLLLWLSVAAGIMIYIGIFLKNSLAPGHTLLIQQSVAYLGAALLLATAVCQRCVPNRLGKWFLWSNSLLVFSSFYLYLQQYYFLAILVPRLVHDTTAYFFYVTHDYNKHLSQPKNLIYRLAKRCKVHYFIVLPALSFGLAFALQSYGDAAVSLITNSWFGFEIRKAVTLGLLGYLALMHYYTESFTWKQDSPYRKFIAFTK